MTYRTRVHRQRSAPKDPRRAREDRERGRHDRWTLWARLAADFALYAPEASPAEMRAYALACEERSALLARHLRERADELDPPRRLVLGRRG